MSDKNIKLSTWLRNAEEFYNASLTIDPKTMKVSMFLLHHSIELFLKAVLLNAGKVEEIHNLEKLYNKVLKELPEVNDLQVCDFGFKHPTASNLAFWIRYINPFGHPKGGLKYLQVDRTSYVAPLGIQSNFMTLIELIKSSVDGNKNISDLL